MTPSAEQLHSSSISCCSEGLPLNWVFVEQMVSRDFYLYFRDCLIAKDFAFYFLLCRLLAVRDQYFQRVKFQFLHPSTLSTDTDKQMHNMFSFSQTHTLCTCSLFCNTFSLNELICMYRKLITYLSSFFISLQVLWPNEIQLVNTLPD